MWSLIWIFCHVPLRWYFDYLIVCPTFVLQFNITSQSLDMRVSCPCHWRTSDMTLGQESDDLFRPLFIICYGHYNYDYWFVCGAYGCILDLTCYLYMLYDYDYYIWWLIVCSIHVFYIIGELITLHRFVYYLYAMLSGLVIDSCVPVFFS